MARTMGKFWRLAYFNTCDFSKYFCIPVWEPVSKKMVNFLPINPHKKSMGPIEVWNSEIA